MKVATEWTNGISISDLQKIIYIYEIQDQHQSMYVHLISYKKGESNDKIRYAHFGIAAYAYYISLKSYSYYQVLLVYTI